METTLNKKNTRVLIDVTHKIGDCLEQGGLCGRILSVPLEPAIKILDCTIDDLDDGDISGHQFELLMYHLADKDVKIIRKGIEIE